MTNKCYFNFLIENKLSNELAIISCTCIFALTLSIATKIKIGCDSKTDNSKLITNKQVAKQLRRRHLLPSSFNNKTIHNSRSAASKNTNANTVPTSEF